MNLAKLATVLAAIGVLSSAAHAQELTGTLKKIKDTDRKSVV